MNKIPDRDYKKILENMPVCCVDVVVHHDKKVLLVKRNDEPAKDYWFIPGGRILKNEGLYDAARRKVKEETGLDVEIEREIGVYETFYDEGVFPDLETGVHSICIDFVAKPVNGFEVKIDSSCGGYRWIDNIEEKLHPYVKKLLRDSRVFD